MGPWLCAGNHDDEPSSVPWLARSGDMSTVGVDQLLDDGQADSTPCGVPNFGPLQNRSKT